MLAALLHAFVTLKRTWDISVNNYADDKKKISDLVSQIKPGWFSFEYFYGYGDLYARLYWTGFGLDASIVEKCVMLAALLHAFVTLKRTWDISVNNYADDKKK